MTNYEHDPNGEGRTSKFSWDPDDVTILRAGDEDYDDEDDLVGDEDERIDDDDDEEIEILDAPDDELDR